jgi:uncharacterized membrane protein
MELTLLCAGQELLSVVLFVRVLMNCTWERKGDALLLVASLIELAGCCAGCGLVFLSTSEFWVCIDQTL